MIDPCDARTRRTFPMRRSVANPVSTSLDASVWTALTLAPTIAAASLRLYSASGCRYNRASKAPWTFDRKSGRSGGEAAFITGKAYYLLGKDVRTGFVSRSAD